MVYQLNSTIKPKGSEYMNLKQELDLGNYN